MSFQFYCPNGHLLQGEESQAGATIACPVCKMEFIIPSPVPQPPPVAPPVVETGSAPGSVNIFEQNSPSPESASDNPFDFVRKSDTFTIGETDYSVAKLAAPKTSATVSRLHIPCPSGHILEVTRDMLGEEAICPQCRLEFTLRFEKSLEYQKEKEQRETLQASKVAKAWLTWSILAAVGVLILVFFLIYTS